MDDPRERKAKIHDLLQGANCTKVKSAAPSARSDGTSIKFMKRLFPDDEAIVRYIFSIRERYLARCDVCNGEVKLYRRKNGTSYSGFCCSDVYKSATKGTVLFKSNIPLKSWFLAMVYFANSKAGISTGFLSRMFGLAKSSAHRLGDRIRTHMALLEADRQVGGQDVPVSISFKLIHGSHDRNSRQAKPLLALALHDPSEVVTAIIPNRRIQTLTPIILMRVRPGSILTYRSDIEKRLLMGYGYHRTLSNSFRIEPVEIYGKDLNIAVSYWTNFRRILRSSHGHFKRDNAWKYIGEFNFRFNRRTRVGDIFWDMISRCPPLPTDIELSLSRSRRNATEPDQSST